MPTTEPSIDSDLAPGSVVVRDEEWLVREPEDTADGLMIHVQGLSELERDTGASFYRFLDDIGPLDPGPGPGGRRRSPRFRKVTGRLSRFTSVSVHGQNKDADGTTAAGQADAGGDLRTLARTTGRT